MRSESIRDQFPIFNAYGANQEFLDNAAAAAVGVEGRIRSIWPFIVRRCLAFAKSIKPRERTHFDPEDILSEIWVKLAEKDALWSPDRGKYITFAGVIIDRELGSIRDKARTVHAPRNSAGRMKDYRKEEADGSITRRRSATASDIRRTRFGSCDIAHASGVASLNSPVPLDFLSEEESRAAAAASVASAIKKLSPLESMVIGRIFGLWGKPEASVWLVAWEFGRSQEEVRRIKDRAVLKIRKHLAATGAATSSN